MSHEMFEAGYHSITSIDMSRVAIKQMRERYPNLTYTIGNAYSLEFPNDSFDTVIAKATVDVIMCTEAGNDERLFLEVSRVLRPNGLFIVVSIDSDLTNRLESPENSYGWSSVTRSALPRPRLRPSSSPQDNDDNGGDSFHYVYLCRQEST